MFEANLTDFTDRAKGILARFGIENALPALLTAYTEPWRGYHNVSHIVRMLRVLDEIPEYVQQNEERYTIALMILYHDAWYKVKCEPGENEHKSAEWALRDLGSNAPERLRYCVELGIVATASHQLVVPTHRDLISVLLDLDLYGLGMSYEEFQRDTEAIWLEYQPVYTREEYDAGRARWAAEFLKRDKFYLSPHFEHLEQQARSNLERLAATDSLR